MKVFKKPDLNKPRFRKKTLDILSNNFFEEFKQLYPEFNSLTNKELKEKIKMINKKIYQEIIENRDGVELPNRLGIIFIGSCKPASREYVDYKKSAELGVKVILTNLQTDGYLAKVFYNNYEYKYHYRFFTTWGFAGVREFVRNIKTEYLKDWQKYVIMSNLYEGSNLNLKDKIDTFNKEHHKLENYNELEI